MRKVLGYVILLYGKPYLKAAVRALVGQVDHVVILYTDQPSQGFQTTLTCPDTEEELQNEIKEFGNFVTWHKGHWEFEGDHTEAVRQFQDGFDWLVRFDSDEIYSEGSVARLIEQAEATSQRVFRVPFLHFWRTFAKVCRDGQMPDRLFRVKGGEGFAYLDDGFLLGTPEINRVFHMGYAQPTEYIRYKMEVQAHRPEWRGGWLEHTWIPNKQTDVHPVIFDFWNTEDFLLENLPRVLKEHRFYGLEVIE